MKLYYFQTPNCWKACAVAKHVNAPVELVELNPQQGDLTSDDYLAINPNAKVPALVDGDLKLWESNAIMGYLAQQAGSSLWPDDDMRIEQLRWTCWDMMHFSRHGGTLFFENLIKPRFGLGETNQEAVEEATGFFRRFAAVLDNHLADREYILGDRLTVVDFSAACMLPNAEPAGIPVSEFSNIVRWFDRMMALPACQDPFTANATAA